MTILKWITDVHRYAFSEDGGPTIIPKPDPYIPIGQRDGPSPLDIHKINLLYNCGKNSFKIKKILLVFWLSDWYHCLCLCSLGGLVWMKFDLSNTQQMERYAFRCSCWICWNVAAKIWKCVFYTSIYLDKIIVSTFEISLAFYWNDQQHNTRND